MIAIFFILIGAAAMVTIGFYIGSNRGSKKIRLIKKNLLMGTGRFGIINRSYSYHDFVLEIKEIEEAGDLTKVRIIDIIKPSGISDTYTSSYILEKLTFNNWVKTKDIIWYKNNSQKIRENKINEILENGKNIQ